MNEELTLKILRNADHPVTKTLIYIHSMQTFIYGDLKEASLNLDCSRVKTFGPFARVMGIIVCRAYSIKLK